MTFHPLACGVHEARREMPCPVCPRANAENERIAEESGRAWRESTNTIRAEAVERVEAGEKAWVVALDYGVSREMVRLWCHGRTSGKRKGEG